MATLAPVPVEVYLHSSYEPDAEFVDGEVELRPPGEFDHATWQQGIQLWFALHRAKWNIRVLYSLRVRVSATRYRVPDVVVFDRAQPTEQILTRPPIAVFEVLSPEDVMTRVLRKLSDYTEMGVRNIFVIDPRTETFYRFSDGALSPMRGRTEAFAGSVAELDVDAISALRN